MITNIFLCYRERTPVGSMAYRYDDVQIGKYESRAKEYVTKAIAFLFKEDRDGFAPCDCIRFDYDNGKSILCEVKAFGDVPVWENKSIVTVTNLDGGCRESTYNIDRNTLKKQLLKELPKE